MEGGGGYERQWKGAKVERWTGRISGLVDWWAREMQEAVGRGRGMRTRGSAKVQMCKGGKVKAQGTHERQWKGANVQKCKGGQGE